MGARSPTPDVVEPSAVARAVPGASELVSKIRVQECARAWATLARAALRAEAEVSGRDVGRASR